MTSENGRFSETRPSGSKTLSCRFGLIRTGVGAAMCPANRELWPDCLPLDGRDLGGDGDEPAPASLLWDDRASASVSAGLKEICQCLFTNDFATSSALSAADHSRGTILPACLLLLPRVPPIARHARPQQPRMARAMAPLTARRRSSWMISRLPKAKNSSGLVATATVTGHEN